jgi:predicted nuclease with TOPRIM domain
MSIMIRTGLHSLRTMSSVRKPNTNDADSALLKLYILEKERKRLRTDQTRLQLKLNSIRERLKEIDKCFIDVGGMRTQSQVDSTPTDTEEES